MMPPHCLFHPERVAVEKGPYCDGNEFLCAECAEEYLQTEPAVPCRWRPPAPPRRRAWALWDWTAVVLLGIALAFICLAAIGLVAQGVEALREVGRWMGV